MKFKMLVAAVAALMMVSCSSENEHSERNESKVNESSISESTADAEELIEPATTDKIAVNIDISNLSTEKHGYGQGVQFDNKNRPQGAIDFNNMYSKYNAQAIGDENEKVITLTFDEGYENGYTAKILDTLKEKNAKATFFVVQDYAEKNPELVKRMIDEGHKVGSHSVSHRSMPLLTEEECKNEIMEIDKYIKDNFNYQMTEFRPPMGEYSEKSLAITNNCGYKSVLWSFAYADWDVNKQPERSEALEKLKKAIHNGAIYLLHPVSSTNSEILGDFIDYAESQGYVFK